MVSNTSRDYFKDYELDYPIGIVLKEPIKDRKKANELEKKLNENNLTASILGGLGGLSSFGLSSYLAAKSLNPDAKNKLISHGVPVLLGGIAGLSIGATTASILNRYINYKKTAEKEGIKTGVLNYSLLDEGGLIARLLKKDKEKIDEYQKINTKLKIAELASGSLAGTATLTGLSMAGMPIAGALSKTPAFYLAGNYFKNKMYNKLLTN